MERKPGQVGAAVGTAPQRAAGLIPQHTLPVALQSSQPWQGPGFPRPPINHRPRATQGELNSGIAGSLQT